MSDQTNSRFTPSNKTVTERISDSTVGLVALSDFRKRRAEVLDQQDREREAALSGASTPDRSISATPDPASDSAGIPSKPKKKKKKIGGSKLSFGDDEEPEEDSVPIKKSGKAEGGDGDKPVAKAKVVANSSVAFVPKVMSKAALRREAAEREALRREFLAIQEAVKATEIAIPFVFYDGSNIPGGTVRVKKGDYIWVFLDKSRKVGAELGVGEKANARREWARVGVDDLMLVRGSIIIPHHYEFYFFILNQSAGPGGQLLFNYSAEAPPRKDLPEPEEAPAAPNGGLTTAAALKAAAVKALPDINTLEGATDDPTLTKVVDRRWYERNKHIYPASMWQEFDPEKDYNSEVRKDAGGNTFFFSR
ncbi:Xap5 domain protein [Colletotrichum higginsianum IMI 349063]|uniref:Xap5 domain protein n=1 Tax=Colletotrichum higginsianum (strain IMI 349063) TaxID=759273 RepID=A0A1B7YLG5_COLHI|nr:Xap5 domain protein [Colletotrichum higginsianum IMI 349063]OBR12887.1 Xap5 domain protein [Colletotrichum higginsianum IMI 349063]GJC94560.1 xap5 domain protein [Colletotrichum higginsianum]